MNSTPQLVEPDEDGTDLAALFATTMADLDTRREVMAEAALRLGRPRRRRRLLASVLAGTAAVALVGGLGAYGLTTLSASPSQPVFPAGPPAAAPSTTSPRPTPVPTEPSPTPPAAGRLEARVAALYLKRLAPSGAMSDYAGQQSGDAVYVGTQIDRGEGKVGLQINVQTDFFGGEPDPKAAVRDLYRCGPTYDDCDVVRNEDGSILMTYTESLPGGTSSRAHAVTADFLRGDGTRVVVLTGNVSDTKYGGKPRLGVTLAQARRIVTDPVWDFDRAPSPGDVAEAKRVIKPWRLLPG